MMKPHAGRGASASAVSAGIGRVRQEVPGHFSPLQGHGLMQPIFWRFWWADGYFSKPGLYFYVGGWRGNVRLWGVDFLLQLLILASTLPGIWLAGGDAERMKWGFLLLLAGQPCWILAAWRSGQFAAFAISILYTALWLRAVLNSL